MLSVLVYEEEKFVLVKSLAPARAKLLSAGTVRAHGVRNVLSYLLTALSDQEEKGGGEGRRGEGLVETGGVTE